MLSRFPRAAVVALGDLLAATLVLLALVLAISIGGHFVPPAHAADDDDSAGDGVDCFPDPGPCGDRPTFSPVSANDLVAECDDDGDGLPDIVLVSGDPHDYGCWADACPGRCYDFSAMQGVWMLEAVL